MSGLGSIRSMACGACALPFSPQLIAVGRCWSPLTAFSLVIGEWLDPSRSAVLWLSFAWGVRGAAVRSAPWGAAPRRSSRASWRSHLPRRNPCRVCGSKAWQRLPRKAKPRPVSSAATASTVAHACPTGLPFGLAPGSPHYCMPQRKNPPSLDRRVFRERGWQFACHPRRVDQSFCEDMNES